MKICKTASFSERVRWRIRGLRCLLVLMVVYMIVVGELGWGDSRVITRFADAVGSLLFFGGMGWVVWKIRRNRKLLQMPGLLREQRTHELDERNRYLHDKSGGIVWDILFVCLLFATLTASLLNMAAFYTAFAILVLAVGLKLAAYAAYSRGTPEL